MNKGHLHLFPGSYTNLSDTSYQELSNLVVQYPFCQNFRILLLTKCLQEGRQDFKKVLQLTSTYSIDRPFLYKLIQSSHQSTALSAAENAVDTLELSDLEASLFVVKPAYQDNVGSRHLDVEVQETGTNYVKTPVQSEDDEPEMTFSNPLENIFTENEVLDFTSFPLATTASDQSSEILEAESPDQIVPTTTDENNSEPILPDHDIIYPENNIWLKADDQGATLPVKSPDVISLDELFEGIDETDDETADADLKAEAAASFSEIDVSEDTFRSLESVNDLSDISPDTIEFEITNRQFVEESTQDLVITTDSDNFIDWLKHKKNKGSGYEYRLAFDPQKLTGLYEESESEANHKRRDKKGYGLVADVVEKSITESEEVISETLAGILALQGQKDKAINMFERLSLLYPEKSSYFAVKINKIKNS